MTWKNIIKATLPDFIGLPMSGMTNRGFMRQLGYGIFKHMGDGKYEVVKDLENWASEMSPMMNPDGLSSKALWNFNAALQNIWQYDNYKGTDVYNTIFQGGGSE